MKPPASMLLFLLLVQGILVHGTDCFSLTTSSARVVVPGRGVQAMNVTVGLNGEGDGEELGGKIAALSRKGAGSGGGSGSGGRGGRGATGSGGTDISHRPRSRVSAAPSTCSDPLFLVILGLAYGAIL